MTKGLARPHWQRSLHSQVMDQIGCWIVRGEIPVGSALPNEDDLCQRLSVSRTVVREVIKVLAAKGMVRPRPRIGTIVRPRSEWKWLDEDVLRWEYEAGPSPEFLHNLIEIRRTIEPAAAQFAALRATEDEIQQLREAYAALVPTVDDNDRYTLADMTFHSIIFAACHNHILEQLANSIADALRASRKVTGKLLEGLPSSLPLHEDVVEAIARRDAASAFAAMNRLIDRAQSDIEQVLAQDNPDTLPQP